MRVLVWLLLVTLPCLALHESDAGKIDWHKELIGLPRIDTVAVAPRFEQAAGRKPSSFIVTVSRSNVIAAINAVDGTIAWRHVLDMLDLVGVYRSNPGFVVTLSGPGGAHLRSYEATTGHLLFDSLLHKSDAGRLLEPVIIGQDVAFSVDKTSDVFALTNAYAVHRVDGLTGETKWTWMSEDQSSSILFCKIVATEATLYLVGLTKSFKGYTLHVVALDASTGTTISSLGISSNVNGPSDFITLTSARTPQPILVWLEDGYIKSVVLAPELNLNPRTIREDVYKELRDVGIADAGIVLALKQEETSHVIRVDKIAQGVEKVWEFANSEASSDQSESVYSSGIDMAGQPYVARTYWSHVMKASSFQLFAANGAEGKGMVTGFTFAFDPVSHGSIQHFALEVANPQPYVFVARSMFTTSTGALQLWQQEAVQWTREESLAEIQAVEFVDLPEKKIVEDALDGHNFIKRLLRQIKDARGFQDYFTGFARRFLTGSSGAQRGLSRKASDGSLWRDTFGFRKLLVASSSTGKVFGIDTTRGDIIWSRLLVEGSHGGGVMPFKLFPLTTVSDGRKPEIVLVGHRHSPSDDTSAVLYHFEALTGLDVLGDGQRRDILTGVEVFRGTIADAYLLRGGNKTVVIVGDDYDIRLYPDDSLTRASFSGLASSLHFNLESTKHLTGYHIHPAAGGGAHRAFSAWTASLDPSEHIQAIIRRPHEPVASLGKVLGDRRTLYKYLNPHLVAVLTTSKAVRPQCSVYLVDGAKGTALYHTTFPAAGGSCNTQATLTENWLVYHYYDEVSQASDSAKGYRMVSVEMYEGTGTDNKTGSADLSSYSYDSSLLTLFQQSFVYPHGITALTTTSTKFGISSKDLIVANTKHQIQSVPRRFLDPRRPKTKPTAEEQEEWLIQYDPVIPDDPRRVISHNYRVAGTRKIATSPALLESTSIILAYGLDLFLTRVAPSGTFDVLSESFNKLQLMLTAVALAMGVVITKPIVHRKQMRQRWYYS
ncbi:DUF1620-domain-containing protein [Gautieria morchelliformis]|nr:DUF1620-domain-containing protein [Gautieria morchelliformis]